jgi:hypothetical protein
MLLNEYSFACCRGYVSWFLPVEYSCHYYVDGVAVFDCLFVHVLVFDV